MRQKILDGSIKKFDLEEYLPLKVVENLWIEKSRFAKKVVVNKQNLKGSIVNFIEKNKFYKEEGNLGEEFIYNYEIECVKHYKLPDSKKVKWVSRDEGDGLGYDILSYDKYGNEIYIEVKTTTQGEEASFYITANELLKSEQEKERYYLYRVYNFDIKKKIGKISVKRGSLKDLCVSPYIYKVSFE